MNKIFVCSLFCLVFIAVCDAQSQYDNATSVVKNCYANIHNSKTYIDHTDYYGYSKKTMQCPTCNQMTLRSIEFVYDYMDSKVFKSEEILVNTCTNQDCKYFALYNIPLHEESATVQQKCLYKGKCDKLEDVLLED